MSGSRGLFIVLEGIDGSGTTTQAELLSQWLTGGGCKVHLTREPSSGPVGRFLRQALKGELLGHDAEKAELDWTAMALLFAADRMDHIVREVEPALCRGATVISDRYDLSSLLYQSLTSPEGSSAIPWLRELNRMAPRPDLTLVLDLPASIAEARRAERGCEPELYERTDLQRKLRDAYAKAEDILEGDAIEIVQGIGNIDEVQAALRKIVAARLEFAPGINLSP